MSDGTLARRLAGAQFRRADTLRDERNGDLESPVEEFLRRWLQPRPARGTRRAFIDRFAAEIAADSVREHSNDELREALRREIAQIRAAGPQRQCLITVLRLVGEAARRTLGFRPHPVQYYGAYVLLQGQLAEMRTGEGKTLVAAIAATAMAAQGCSVHVISTNDYLAQRDAEEMSPLFRFFGLSAGSIKDGMEPPERRQQYARPICYVSGKELVFDYLKDRMAGHGFFSSGVEAVRKVCGHVAPEPPVVPALHFAIVDEADSVLIDEARTPLIISRESEGAYEPELLAWAIAAAKSLRQDADFTIDERNIELLPGTVERCGPPPVTVRAVWTRERWRALLLRQALTALHLFIKDQHYILADGKVQIVDESTGRVMPDRSWEQGLHQLIECKEELELTAGRETILRMTFQRFFRKYYLLSGLTGTAAEAARELWNTYGLRVTRIPPNRPDCRHEYPALCVAAAAQKWELVAEEAMTAAARGQPVLVGTRSVEGSEAVAAVLTARGVPHVVLNARQDQDEANIVKQAGRGGTITVATNMAGRGTDIKLDNKALEAGGLHVILTEYHSSPRVDRQLFGRSGRQGDPGTVRAIAAADDELMREHASGLGRLLARPMPAASRRAALKLIVRYAQWRSERQARKVRAQTLKNDQTLHRLIGFAGKTL